jgi:hypothetical protein
LTCIKLHFSFIMAFMLALVSCNEDSILENEYTRIVSSLCNGKGDYCNFSKKNTQYFDLMDSIPLKMFVFVTDCNCQYWSGTCGMYIEVYGECQGEYKILYNACGFRIRKLDDSHMGVHSFEYAKRTYPVSNKWSKIIQVGWNGASLFEDVYVLKE